MALQNRSITGQERTLQLSHTASTTALTPLLINSKVFIPLNTKGANALNAFLYQAEVSDWAATSAETWAVGDKLYFVTATGALSNVASGNTLCGYALEAKAGGVATSGLVHFHTFAA